ncbi:hypothetical protein [uncultured Photobacterium sp.]|uniref:lipase family protein n=1 Tax=uncultured Photobacterium sp. TaxID=173973 RepID=UPI002639805A|nr:hypothetical protein [uncultured Photobacterium sp.]
MAYTKEQLMLAFSYMSYYGITHTGSAQENAELILKKMNEALKEWKPFQDDDWEVVWGPAVYTIPYTIFNDAMMYVVQKKGVEGEYVIAIRGTNPVSISDWLFNDFMVRKMKKWPYASVEDRKLKISKSTSYGLKTLQKLKPKSGIPGEGKTVLQFLNEKIGTEGKAKVCVTGHSKGGALSSTAALWLKDIQGKELSTNIDISTIPFAGPTAGNADFANYFDEQLGDKCTRVANSLDIVPYAWNTKSLKKLKSLYLFELPPVLPSPFQRALITGMIAETKGKKYKQIKAETPPLEGEFNPLLIEYLVQAAYQHVVGYPEQMNMMDDIPLTDIFEDAIAGLL